MPLLFIYLFKLSVSLAVMYLFYQLLLRRLTFYNHNRWYLVGYSVLCFFIPFINISSALEKNETAGYDILKLIPTVENFTAGVSPVTVSIESLTIWDWLMIVLLTGIAIMLTRLIIQFISFRKIKENARLIADESIKFYQVDKNIIPFSFGNSIFINQELHTEAELKEIIRHEFVHVKQKHTIDIIWAEILCILNWYNPFVWLIRRSIRQNLEFIADNRVLANGMDKKQYQYLLLKVIGNNHFRIVNQFNFSSLKKRIVMMNKMKTARVHLIRFLFVLPLLAVVLLSFRSSNVFKKEAPSFIEKIGFNNSETGRLIKDNSFLTDKADTIKPVNSKGYFIDIKDNKGNCMVVIKDKYDKEIKKLLITEWNKKEKYYEDLYGEIPPAFANCDVPPAKAMPVQPGQPSQSVQPGQPPQPARPAQPLQPASPRSPVQLRNITLADDSKKPLVIVDGVEWPASLDMNMIDVDRIETVNVLKDAGSFDLYGDKGKNGVVIITTKRQAATSAQPVQIRVTDVTVPANPVYYLNGKQTTKEAVELVDPANIRSIDVLKGSKAEEKYGEKGKNGVIEIRTITPTKVNYIEKKRFPEWDIKNVLPGKKRDEC